MALSLSLPAATTITVPLARAVLMAFCVVVSQAPEPPSDMLITLAGLALAGKPETLPPEAQMMPPGKPWRTGADVATIIKSDKPLTFGNLKLEPGSYTLNTQPGEKWELIIGKLSSPNQWGIPYKPELELGRMPMTVTKASTPVEQLTISIDDTAAGATLRIEWGTTKATAPFKLRLRGRSGHASDPHSADNPLLKAGPVLEALARLEPPRSLIPEVQAFLETVLGEVPPLEEALDRTRSLHPLAGQLVEPCSRRRCRRR